MRCVTVTDRDPATQVLTFDLRDLLAVLGPDVARSRWAARDVEALGGTAATVLHAVSASGEMLNGERLIELALQVDQIIDGEFSGYLADEARPWAIIRAVDSSAYDICCDLPEVLSAIRLRFSQVDDVSE